MKQTNLSRLRSQQTALSLLLMTVVVVMIWVMFSIYSSYAKTTSTVETKVLITPLNPKLDTTLLDQLAKRKNYSPEELKSAVPTIAPLATIAPVATKAPISASGSAIPTATPTP